MQQKCANTIQRRENMKEEKILLEKCVKNCFALFMHVLGKFYSLSLLPLSFSLSLSFYLYLSVLLPWSVCRDISCPFVVHIACVGPTEVNFARWLATWAALGGSWQHCRGLKFMVPIENAFVYDCSDDNSSPSPFLSFSLFLLLCCRAFRSAK